MAPHMGTRAAQPGTSSGLGTHFSSPRKLRDKQKTQVLVEVPGQKAKHNQLLAKMASLLASSATQKPEETSPVLPETETDAVVLEDDANEAWEDVPEPHDNCSPQSPSQSTLSHHTQPDLTSTHLYNSWKALIPTLVEIQLDYTARTLACTHVHKNAHLLPVSFSTGEIIQEPFCRSLGYAIQWFNVLQIEVECQLEAALQMCHDHVEASEEKGLQEHCAPILIQRCPACFGGVQFGQDLNKGGDIHVATDGNFHHRHRRSAGDSPHFYDPSYFLPKVQVDAIGHHITRSRKSTPKLHVSHVPNEAIDLCENSYEAAEGKKQKAAMDSFDDTGLMALICRHDIPLFFANIDSPGEQQKYSVALINHLFSLLPWSATVVTLYDVGCVLSRSLNQTLSYNTYGLQLLQCMPTVTNGLRQHRLWLINQHAGLEMRANLRDWIRRQLRCGVEDQGTAAQKLLEECEVAKELDTVLALQADLDASASDKALQTTRDTIVKVLYASLNVQDRFLELDGLNLKFVRTLLLAHDLKMNIRKHAIGSFFKWDKLDRAVGGSQQALGTKLHQQTRKVIAKHQPALMAALCKFNAYCEHLEALYDLHCGIPLPTPLPTRLTNLRNDQSLMEDIWITPSTGKVPRWLDDQDVHNGIRAMLKRDRCVEEQQHLGLEADNLCRWFGNELSALELALLTPGYEKFLVPLRQQQEHLQYIQTCWTTSLASAARFASCATDA
ncbi:hypothetical protein BDR05DRAFT_947110, partial [Suillus weaverae]